MIINHAEKMSSSLSSVSYNFCAFKAFQTQFIQSIATQIKGLLKGKQVKSIQL